MLQLNLKNKAVVQTTEPFNSMCKFGEYYLGVTENGISKICGYSDNGVEINASMKSGITDFGISQNKQFRAFYFSGESNGNLKAVIYADGIEVASLIIIPNDTGFFDVKMPFSCLMKARYWQWEILNIDGSFFVLYEVNALPIVLHPGRLRK